MPNTIAENLTRLQTARTNIANAITAKGGTVSQGDGLEDFPSDIGSIPSTVGAYKLTFSSSMSKNTMSTNELYSINSDSSTSVFGYFVLITNSSYGLNLDKLTFSFDHTFTPSFTSVKLVSSSSSITGATISGGINDGKYEIAIQGLEQHKTYTIHIQSLFV